MNWFLIQDSSREGALNMAVDFLLVNDPPEFPLLRLYSWEPAAISIGYNQKIGNFSEELFDEYGFDLVRRPTGGRAVLHCNELTYSVIIPKDTLYFEKSVHDLYHDISKALRHGMNLSGINAEIERNSLSREQGGKSAECFASAARFELKKNGEKIVGSAQRRLDTGILQHGSVFPDRRQYLITKLLYGSIGNSDVKETIAGAGPIDLNMLQKNIITGFEKELSADFMTFDNYDTILHAAEQRKDEFALYLNERIKETV